MRCNFHKLFSHLGSIRHFHQLLSQDNMNFPFRIRCLLHHYYCLPPKYVSYLFYKDHRVLKVTVVKLSDLPRSVASVMRADKMRSAVVLGERGRFCGQWSRRRATHARAAEGGRAGGETDCRAQLSNRKGEGCKSHSGILNLRDLFLLCSL